MRAVQYDRFGDSSVLTIAERDEPHAGPGSVRIRVAAASINPIDRLLRAGALQEILPLELPAVPGRDAAGVVDEVGAGVTDVAIGDRVFGLGGLSDTTAEYAVLTAWAPTPAAWSDEQAAAAGLASVTAWRALEALGEPKNATILIGGAAGAVGGAAAAFALADGNQVIGTASPRNHQRLRELGVIPIAYGEGLVDRVREIASAGVDYAIDAAGAGSLPDLVELTGRPDNVVTVVDHQTAAELGVKSANADNDAALLRRAADLAGSYTPYVNEVLPFADAAEAHARSEAGGGKIVLRIDSGT
ncbi:NADP-dependent oxidoreductase [Branchiibius sp. NY16-3462-2]|uniref:NADP-dependent oxidoreductase n=1 Tax=Branchiibius sp. NY16-3462-2 TaxID=1807500 RepID=UPI00079BF428|nr:NADP-dependent oxidoreductase [Branchiibius sp. NY16-3462-2]KYH45351.1 NADPH:quinone reductase [Branchiibius sp. NY16-3462-2]